MDFKEFLTDEENGLGYDDDHLKDIVNHGCSCGFSGITYYIETTEIYNDYEDQIWDLLEETSESFGHGHPLELIASFNGAKDVHGDDQFKNLLVWFAVEETARQILSDKGIEV